MQEALAGPLQAGWAASVLVCVVQMRADIMYLVEVKTTQNERFVGTVFDRWVFVKISQHKQT